MMKTILVGSVALVMAAVLMFTGSPSPLQTVEQVDLVPECRVQATANLTAVITPLPDEVSNGTPTQLDARDSFVDDGWIVSYLWTIVHAGSPEYLSGMTRSYTFSALGAYQITLTVTDNESNVAEAVESVYAVMDLDLDELPDWWESAYFGNDLAAQNGDGDPDDDGYSNLQEYASETDPTVWDPKPTLVQILSDNWYFIVAVAAAVVVAIIIVWPRMRKKRKEQERKKIEAALEIERALGEEK